MSGFTPTGGSGGLPIQTTSQGAELPAVSNVDMPSASTEYQFQLPTGTKQFLIKLRGSGRLQLSYQSGESGTQYNSIPRYCFGAMSGLTLTTPTLIYFQSDLASQVAEILVWT